LAGTQPLTALADAHDVSRKFVSQQASVAQRALDDAFAPAPADQKILFTVPVTKALLRQIVLGLILICHSSFRGVVEFLQDVLGFRLSLGTVAGVVRAAVGPARARNEGQDLSAVRQGAHDEIYQSLQPVLVGADVDSTYCYLLSQEEHRDSTTWGVRLLELQDRGFAPEATVAEGGTGLRAGQELALPGVPCQGDVFHVLRSCGQLARSLEARAYAALQACVDLERQLATPGQWRDRHKLSLAQRLRQARPKEAAAVTLCDDVAVLLRWLREDVLAVAGPDLATRQALLEFVRAELQTRARRGPLALKELCQLLKSQGKVLLAFVGPLDEALAQAAARWGVPVTLARELLRVQALPAHSPRRGPLEAALRQQLRGRYHGLSVAVAQAAGRVVRASSVAENLNSRLRNYFFLRRQLGSGYLSLLQFFLNHRRFQRSERGQRVGRSPAELLTGKEQPHWLELLGYQRFQRN
jgi:hypothetical protein